MTDSFIGLGANIDSPVAQLQRAVSALASTPGIQLIAVSRAYESAPMGPQDQPDFVNACAHIRTSMSAIDLLRTLKVIEQNQGRVKTRRWGERCIDLDLLLHGDCSMATPELALPHPGIPKREFVLTPLIELVGEDFRMPDGRYIAKLRADCPPSTLRPLEVEWWAPAATGNSGDNP